MTTSESFEAVHDALMRPEHEPASVGIEEVLDAVGAEFDDVTCTVGVTDEVWLNTQVLITVSGIRPEDIDDELLFRC